MLERALFTLLPQAPDMCVAASQKQNNWGCRVDTGPPCTPTPPPQHTTKKFQSLSLGDSIAGFLIDHSAATCRVF